MTADNTPASYSDQSLTMLDSEEGQLNAVFACFGSAAQHAQLFERALAKFLLVYNRICSVSISLNDLEAIEEKLQRRTMGQLLKELSKHVTLTDPRVAEFLDHVLEKRNFLMHQFFLARKKEFTSEEARKTLLIELVTVDVELDQARIMVEGMRVAMCRTLGFDDDEPA